MTSPFTAVMQAQMAARSQATKWKTVLGVKRTFSAHCCDIDSGSIMGVAKEPVVIAHITPNPLCLGDDFYWDLTDSYAPGSTITYWEIDFGNGDSEDGNDISTAANNASYGAVGTYTISIYLEEGLGKNTTYEMEIEVVDCSIPPGSWSYASTNGRGVFYIDWLAAVPDWVAINNGLIGDALTVRNLVIDPNTKRLAYPNHILWIATLGGIYKTSNSGNYWEFIELPEPSNDEFSDAPAATLTDLDFKQVVIYNNVVYAAAQHKTLQRVWIYKLEDNVWSNRGVVKN